MSGVSEGGGRGHAFRPGLLRRHRVYWLEGDALYWRIGPVTGQVALDQIVVMRLDLPSGGAAVTARCELVDRSGRRHRIADRHWFRWTRAERRRFGRHERRTASFRALCLPLARRLRQVNPQARLLAGPGRGEWIATCVVAAMAVAVIIGGAGLMIAQRRPSLPALAAMALMVAYLPLLVPVIRSGGPQPFDPGPGDAEG